MITGPAFFLTTLVVLWWIKRLLKNNRLLVRPTQEGGYRIDFEEK